MATATVLRADAQRNRDALLEAARTVFAEKGFDAPLAEVARRAGVGQGTLYRRFSTRAALVDAVLDSYLAEVRALADEVDDEPEALFELLRLAARLQRENRMLLDALKQLTAAPACTAVRTAFAALFEGPLRRAQEAGLVRRDATAADARLLLRMVGGASARGSAPDETERALELARDALRPASG